MGRTRGRKTKKERAAYNKKHQDRYHDMSADDFEKAMESDMMLIGGMGGPGVFGEQAQKDKDFFANMLKDKRAAEAKTATQGHIGDMVKQYTGQDLPPPPGSAGGPKGQQQGGSPKGQQQPQVDTGATPGSYMDRMRKQRGAAGTPGFEQYAPPQQEPEIADDSGMGGMGSLAPLSPKGRKRRPRPRRGGGHPKMGAAMGGGMPHAGGTPTPYQPPGRPNTYANAFRPPPRQSAPRRYNPLTGMME